MIFELSLSNYLRAFFNSLMVTVSLNEHLSILA